MKRQNNSLIPKKTILALVAVALFATAFLWILGYSPEQKALQIEIKPIAIR
jgi:hypothetical protein